MFRRIERFHVNVYEPHIRVLELGVGCGSEVRVTSTHPNHHIGFVCQMVRTISPGRADAPHGAFMIKVDGAFTRLGIRNRDSGRARQIAQFLGGFRINRAAAGNNQGTLRRLNDRCRPRHLGFRYCRTAHMPNPLFKHFYRPIEGFGLYVLWHCQHYGSGFCRVGEDAHGVHQRGH